MRRINHSSRFIEMFGDTLKNTKDWEFSRLPEVTTIVLGTTPSSSNPDYWDGDIKWITPAELDDDSFVLTDSERHITEEGVKNAGLKSFPAGTIIFSTRAPIGKTAIAGCEMYCNQGFKNFICSDALNPVYLFYTLRVHKEELQKMGTGSTFLELSKKTIENISVSVPDRSLQDEFEVIYKQADKSKFSDFKSRFIEQFSKPEITRVPLIDLCSLFIDGDWIEAKDQSDSGYRLVQTGNVGVCEYLDKKDHSRFVSEDTFKRLNCTEIHSGDILFSRLPDPIGRCCIIPKDFPKAITAVDCTITRLKDNCLPEYLMIYTTTTMYSEQIKKCVTGTTRQRISRGNLAKITIPLPDKTKQVEFVNLVHQADKSKYLN